MLRRSDLVPQVAKVEVLTAGLLLRLKTAGVMLFLGSFHLPHSQRDDCEQVWQDTQAELHRSMLRLRHQDDVLLGWDASLDLSGPCDGSGASVTARCIMAQLGLESTRPVSRTWWNYHRSRELDFILHGAWAEFLSQDTKEYMGHLLGADHALVSATVRTLRVAKLPRRRRFTKCGKWCVNPATLVAECQKLHDELHGDLCPCVDVNSLQPLHACALCMESIQALASRISFRPRSFRYQDSPAIKALIAQRRELTGEEAHLKAAEIVQARRACKQAWLAEVLTKARHGDFSAISYMKRRQSMGHTHTSYVLKAGNEHKALSDLRSFYQSKYTCERLHDSTLSVQMVSAHVEGTMPDPFTAEEISGVLSTMKRGKSCGLHLAPPSMPSSTPSSPPHNRSLPLGLKGNLHVCRR